MKKAIHIRNVNAATHDVIRDRTPARTRIAGWRPGPRIGAGRGSKSTAMSLFSTSSTSSQELHMEGRGVHY